MDCKRGRSLRKQHKARKPKRKSPPKPRDQRVKWHTPLPIRLHYAFIPTEQVWHKTIKAVGVSPREYPKMEGTCMWIERREATPGLPYKNLILLTVKEHYDTFHDKAGIAALIAHESLHVWQYMCEACGEDKPSDELDALFLEQIVHNMLNDFCRTRKNIFR